MVYKLKDFMETDPADLKALLGSKYVEKKHKKTIRKALKMQGLEWTLK